MYLFVFQIWIGGIRRLTTPKCLGILINFQLSKVLCHATPEGSLSLVPDGRCRRYSTLHHRRFSSYNPRWYNDCRLSTTKVSHPTQARHWCILDSMVSRNAPSTIVSYLSMTYNFFSIYICAGNALLRSRFTLPTPIHRTILKSSAGSLNRRT